jgi:glycosyltransferase involved in cell wall biosynthesis
MKILHIEGGRNLYGGAHQLLLLMEGLKALGHENILICRRAIPLAEAAMACAEVAEIDMGGDLDFRLIARLHRLIRASCPDIVHLNSRIGADVMGGIAARLAGVPTVHTRRQDNPESRLAVALKYRLHDRVVAISDGIGRVLLSEGLPPGKLRVVRDALDPAPFSHVPDKGGLAATFGFQSADPVIGVVAQLIARKGHRFLLEAMPTVLASCPRTQVLIFGKGPLDAALREQIDHLGLVGHVRLVGFRDDLPRILPSLDLLVHPALMEGLGVSLLQASACRVPIVASAVGGIPEAVRDGLNGLLVPPGDTPALAKAIVELLPDTARRQAMGADGLALVEREFSPRQMVEGHLRVYRELVPWE